MACQTQLFTAVMDIYLTLCIFFRHAEKDIRKGRKLNNRKTAGEVCRAEISLIASEKNWVEGEALKQLEKAAELPGMLKVVGLPDIHPGRGFPVGAAFVSREIIYPHLIGSDAGCGVGLWRTSFRKRKFRRDKWMKKLADLENPWQGNRAEWLLGTESSEPDDALGTIGGGNHFAELQAIEKIYDEKLSEALQIDKKILMLAVHSGSRNVGNALFRAYAEKYGTEGLNTGSEAAEDYFRRHGEALKWAEANRSLIAYRMCGQLGGECEKTVDIFHNGISEIGSDENLWVHRKGAVPADRGPVLIPGTRGSLTYLVSPTGEQHENACSLAHGAGRRWNRKTSRDRLKSRYTAKSFLHTELGGCIICEDKDLLFEEAPQAYKNIDTVINDMVESGLIAVIASLRPLITYKVRKTA